MSRETALAKIAAMAQLLDDAGLHDDATILDELLEAAASPDLVKEAGFWQAILSRLGGWARRALFQEYRTMYASAREAQAKADARLEELQAVNKELKEMLARHMLTDWRDGLAALLPAMSVPVDETLSPYDEQHAKMTARLLKLSPKKAPEPKKSEPIIPPLMPEEDKGPTGTPEEPIPLTKVKKPAPEAPSKAPVPEGAPELPVPEGAPEAPPEAPPETPPAVPAPQAPPTPMPGWKKEKFGTSGKHGWEWEWEVSPDNSRLRLPKNQLAAASSGKGKILHRQDGRYRPTGGTSSVKLRRLMGGVFWEEEDDPSDPNMAILVRTEEPVPFPLSMRQEPAEQARRLKGLGKSSADRMDRLVLLAADEASEEEKLDAAAQILLEGFEREEMEEED